MLSHIKIQSNKVEWAYGPYSHMASSCIPLLCEKLKNRGHKEKLYILQSL